MIDSVRLANFKAFKDVSVQFRALTLLSGLNGVGKSSVIQSLLLLRQSHQSGDLTYGRMTLNGPLVEIGTASDLLFVDANSDEICVGLTFQGAESAFIFSIVPDESSRDESVYQLTPHENNEVSATHLHGTPLLGTQGSFQYLCAERFGPRKSMPMSDNNVAVYDLGKHGEFTLHFLSRYGKSLLLDSDNARFAQGVPARLIDQVDHWLQEISPGAHLELQELRAADLMISGFAFDRPKDAQTRAFRATNVGFGLSYALPVLTALLAAQPGALLVIENPEAHMHPRGQTRLGQLCARAAADGCQVIVETHSDHVMDGARLEVRSGKLRPKDATFHYFERKKGIVRVVTPLLDHEGRLSEWPDGFFDEHRHNTAALIRPRSHHG
ncbi:AAA family ATPase [Rhodomicrobium sp.]|uniref:AAA family ATPase n=1 Tax=Rhodomicrobium sp. TaxID=2720632 RepID=UPI0039E22FED